MNGFLRSGGSWSRSAGDRVVVGLCTLSVTPIGDVASVTNQILLAIAKRLLGWFRASMRTEADRRRRGIEFLRRGTPRNLIFLVSGLTLATPIQSIASPGNLLATNSTFVLYLQNPPWIRMMTFKKSQLFGFAQKGHVDKSIWSYVSYNAAIQPNGIYYERLTAPPSLKISQRIEASEPGSPPESQLLTGKRSVCGISSDFYWGAYWGGDSSRDERSLTLDPRRPEKGGSEKNGPRADIKIHEAELESIRFFGLPPVQPGSFELLGENHFIAIQEDGNTIDGKILNATNDLPLELVYNRSDGAEVSVTYAYGDNPLPNYFESRATLSGQAVGESDTNWIENVEYGLDNKAGDGFRPSMFFTNISRFTYVTISSNGLNYLVGLNGKLVPMNYSVPLHTLLEQSSRVSRWFFVLVLFVSAVAAWAAIRRFKTSAEINNKTI